MYMELLTLSFNAHAHNITTQKEGNFDIEIMKKLRKFQYWAKTFSYKKCILKVKHTLKCLQNSNEETVESSANT